jgi:hypothetical protein
MCTHTPKNIMLIAALFTIPSNQKKKMNINIIYIFGCIYLFLETVSLL